MATGVVVEQVADHIEDVAQVTRQINHQAIRYFGVGTGFGFVWGFLLGYRFNKEKIKAQALKDAYDRAETEIDQIREVYQQKTTAATPKPSVDEVIEERGYATVPPEPERPLKPPVPVTEPPVQYHITPSVTPGHSKNKNDGWDFPSELARRSPELPHIIHQDEFVQNDTGYKQVTYTYFTRDDVLAAEDGTVVNSVDTLVGVTNLLNFGHGSDDSDVVFVRNPKLEVEMEICRVDKSYEQEILGLEHSEEFGEGHSRLRRRHPNRFKDDETD